MALMQQVHCEQHASGVMNAENVWSAYRQLCAGMSAQQRRGTTPATATTWPSAVCLKPSRSSFPLYGAVHVYAVWWLHELSACYDAPRCTAVLLWTAGRSLTTSRARLVETRTTCLNCRRHRQADSKQWPESVTLGTASAGCVRQWLQTTRAAKSHGGSSQWSPQAHCHAFPASRVCPSTLASDTTHLSKAVLRPQT